MKYLSLFSGAGGGDLAMQYFLKFKCIGYVEYENYCQKVIKQRIKDGLLDSAPIFGDIRKFIGENYAESYKGLVDIVSGGFPCTDISCAKSSNAKGIHGEESGLWKEMATVLRSVRPRFAFMENAPALTVRGLEVVLCDLAEMGFNARWCVLGGESACKFGLLRKRIWIVAFRDKVDVERLQIQSQFDVESKFWSYPASTHLQHVETSWFVANSYAKREIDDVARTMERIEATGNGQIPKVAATAWNILTDGLTASKH